MSDLLTEINESIIRIERCETNVTLTQGTKSKFITLWYSAKRVLSIEELGDIFDLTIESRMFFAAVVDRMLNKKITYGCNFFIDDKTYGFNDQESGVCYFNIRIDYEFFSNNYYFSLNEMIVRRDENLMDKSVGLLG